MNHANPSDLPRNRSGFINHCIEAFKKAWRGMGKRRGSGYGRIEMERVELLAKLYEEKNIIKKLVRRCDTEKEVDRVAELAQTNIWHAFRKVVDTNKLLDVLAEVDKFICDKKDELIESYHKEIFA